LSLTFIQIAEQKFILEAGGPSAAAGRYCLVRLMPACLDLQSFPFPGDRLFRAPAKVIEVRLGI
jgi:hypothetical protein